jgi:hypothetical protein
MNNDSPQEWYVATLTAESRGIYGFYNAHTLAHYAPFIVYDVFQAPSVEEAFKYWGRHRSLPGWVDAAFQFAQRSALHPPPKNWQPGTPAGHLPSWARPIIYQTQDFEDGGVSVECAIRLELFHDILRAACSWPYSGSVVWPRRMPQGEVWEPIAAARRQGRDPDVEDIAQLIQNDLAEKLDAAMDPLGWYLEDEIFGCPATGLVLVLRGPASQYNAMLKHIADWFREVNSVFYKLQTYSQRG